MHNLFLVYFINLYMLRAYLGPSSGGTTCVYNNWYLLFFLDDCLLTWLDWNFSLKNKFCIKFVFLYTTAAHVYISSNCICCYQSSVILLSDKQNYIDLFYLVCIRYIHIVLNNFAF